MNPVDLHDYVEFDAYARWLLASCCTHAPVAACDSGNITVEAQLQHLVCEIEHNIHEAHTQLAVTMLGWYDLLHRLAYGRPGDAEFVRRHTDQLLRAYTMGDSRVCEEDMVSIILASVNMCEAGVSADALKWCRGVVARWVSASCGTGRFADITLDRALQRVALVMGIDDKTLFPNVSAVTKRLMFDAFAPCFDMAGMFDGKVLKRLRYLCRILSPAYMPARKVDMLNRRLLSLLTQAEDLHTLEREAYMMELNALQRNVAG